MAKYTYKIVRAELWGNARDGFDTNNWFTLQTITRAEPLTDRWLLRIVRDLFEGKSFAWSENKSTYMSRKGIMLDDIGAESMIQVSYRGYYVGEVQINEVGNNG